VNLLTGEPKRAEALLLQAKPEERGSPALDGLLALARAEQGHPEIANEAIRKLSTAGRRRADLLVLLYASAGQKDLLVKEIARHPFIRNYRWIVNTSLLRPYRTDPPFQKLVREIFGEWQRNLRDYGPSLPVSPPGLPGVEAYLSQP